MTPWLAARLMKSKENSLNTEGTERTEKSGKLEKLFRRLLTPFLARKTGGAARKKLLLVILLLILGSVSLAVVKLVVLKMLPFDNKSEFQIVLDMPVGTPLRKH